jgi:hypothetical protein
MDIAMVLVIGESKVPDTGRRGQCGAVIATDIVVVSSREHFCGGFSGIPLCAGDFERIQLSLRWYRVALGCLVRRWASRLRLPAE